MGQAFGQVNAIGPNLGGKRRIGADQQQQAPLSSYGLEGSCLRLGVRRPKAAVDDGRPARQPPGRAFNVGRALGIGEEQ